MIKIYIFSLFLIFIYMKVNFLSYRITQCSHRIPFMLF